MEEISVKSNQACISTTDTPVSHQYSDTAENDVEYTDLNFVKNPDISSQAQEAFLEYHNSENSKQDQLYKGMPNKILPSWMPFNGVEKAKCDRQLISLQEKSLSEMGYKAIDIDGWEQIVQPSKEDLYKLLKNMIDNHIKPSVQIQIGEVTFNCHMMVLQCYSDFFMECNNEIHIRLPEENITPAAFMMVYDWMLSSQPLVQREGILELFIAANFLRIKELINQCWLCLDDDVRFREDTAFLLYLEARKHDLENLKQLMLMRICKFFLTLVASKDFLTLSAKEVCTLLSSNTVGVNSEIEIFMSAVRWLSHNWPEREPYMLDVVKCVRFSLMPHWFLVTLNKNIDCIEVDRIIDHLEVRKMINDGISYTSIQLYYRENRQEFLLLLERFQLIVPMQRQWLCDKECKYLHRLTCPNMLNINYLSFLEYLEMIRSTGKDYWRTLEMDKGTEKSMYCFLCTDCRKSTESNPATISAREIRDKCIQCPIGAKSRKNKDSFLNKKQQQQSKPHHVKQQQQENKQQRKETLIDSCCSGLIVKSDCIGVQHSEHTHQCTITKRTTGGCDSTYEELIDFRDNQKTSMLIDDLKSNYNHKIFVVGGIDPYYLHHQNVYQLGLSQQNKTIEKVANQPQLPSYLRVYYNQNQQHALLQQKRVNSINSMIKKTTSYVRPVQSYQIQTHANNIFENCGDHVLHYDISSMEWRHLSYIPFGSRHHHAVVVCSGLIYVIGGTRIALDCRKKSVFEKSIWCLNPNTLKWVLETNLPESRRDFAAVAIENKSKYCDKEKQHDIGFYVIGGEGVNGRALNTVWFYNIKRKIWLKKPSLNTGRYGLAAAVVNNQIWIAGGVINSSNTYDVTINASTALVITDTIEIYNLKCEHCNILANNRLSNRICIDDGVDEGSGQGSKCTECQWIKSKFHLRMPRLFGKFCQMSNGALYVVGGISFNEQLKQLTSLMHIDVFNEKLQKWEHAGDLNLARHGHDVATLNDDCLVVIGGVSTYEQCTLTKVEAFCTKTHKSLNDLPDLPWPVSGCAAVALK